MLRIKTKTAICLVAVSLVGTVATHYGCRSGPVHFDNAAEVQALAAATGLHWHWDDRASRSRGTLFLSDHPLDWERIVMLQTSGASKETDWRGVVWIMDTTSTYAPTATRSILRQRERKR
jgi:hypothetical protein